MKMLIMVLQLYYYVKNNQNDIIGILDENLQQIVSYEYDTWGKLLSIKDAQGNDITNDMNSIGYKNPYRYRSYRYDSETELYYLNTRYYNPEIGRFINNDEFISTEVGLLGHNMYIYCNNNPSNMQDINGNVALAIGGVAIGAILGEVIKAAAIVSAATVAAAAIEKIADELKQKRKAGDKDYGYTVYALKDDRGNVRYVGRTKNTKKRKADHERDPIKGKLHFDPLFERNLTLNEARGIEQSLIIYFHTKNALGAGGLNKINGIALGNPMLGIYMEAGKNILGNIAEDEIRNWYERY